MADNVHIEQIDDVDANLSTDLDIHQIAIRTDVNSYGYDEFQWEDDANNRYGAAALGQDAGFAELTLTDDLLLDEYIKRGAGNDDFIRMEDAKTTIALTGIDVMVFEDDKIYSELNSFGFGTDFPLLNVGSASGDFTGDGLHIKSDVASNNQAYLIIEGDSTGHDAAAIILADNQNNSGVNMFEIVLTDGDTGSMTDLELKSLNYNASEYCTWLEIRPITNGTLGKFIINPDDAAFDTEIISDIDVALKIDSTNDKVLINPNSADIDFEFKKALTFDWGNKELVLNPDGDVLVSIGRTTFETWDTAMDVLQIGGNAAIAAHHGAGASKVMQIMQNAYPDENDSRWEYMDTDEATLYQQSSGLHTFAAADSGTADTEIDWKYLLQIGHDGTSYTMEHNFTQDNINWEINSDGYSALLLDADGNSGSGALYSAMLNATKTATPPSNYYNLILNTDTGEIIALIVA